MDKIDLAIIKILKQNSKISLREIGKIVHKSGQAIGVRIKKLEDDGVIHNYTVDINYPNSQLITVYMSNNLFTNFEDLIKTYSDNISEFHKISGDGCYVIKSHFYLKELDEFLEKITQYCRYKVNYLIKKII